MSDKARRPWFFVNILDNKEETALRGLTLTLRLANLVISQQWWLANQAVPVVNIGSGLLPGTVKRYTLDTAFESKYTIFSIITTFNLTLYPK